MATIPSTRSSRRIITTAEMALARGDLTHNNNNNNNHLVINSNKKGTLSTTDLGNRRKRLRDLDSDANVSSEEKRFAGKKPRITSFEVVASRARGATLKKQQQKPSNNTVPRTGRLQSHAADARQPLPVARHHEKVVNGIQHELKRLQPAANSVRVDDKRKLRSQEGTRFKSDLAAYFPDYDVVIGNEDEETHFLNVETPIIIMDSSTSALTSKLTPSPIKPKELRKAATRSFRDTIFDDIYQSQQVDFAFLDHFGQSDMEDPLPDEYYTPHHSRAARLAKSMRNAEKARAQHEKDHVIRLLEGLQGHDWLKVMGVSGITEGKKKDYEVAREHFIRGCQQIIEKFRSWRDEEKRRKAEKDREKAEAAEEEEMDGAEAIDREGEESDGDPPDYSKVDEAAARQLHEEAIARSAPLASSRLVSKRVKVETIEPEAKELEKDFKSFYSKPYLRQAAIGKARRSGRSVSAWGHPLPDVPESDFDLPEELRDRETLEANARRRRRTRRDSKA